MDKANPSESATVETKFDPRSNSFDAMRLAAALLVLFSHCFPLTGSADIEPFARFGLSGGDVAVAIFFVISGFLITRSQERRSASEYLTARALRILPGLAVAVVVTAFAIGPVVSTLGASGYFSSAGTWQYLWTADIFDVQRSLPGVFEQNPYPVTVNGSLWTIALECTAYLLVPILAVMGLLHRRLFWSVVVAALVAYGVGVMVFNFDWRNPGPQFLRYVSTFQALRYLPFFAIGAAFWIYRDRIPLNAALATVAIIAILATNRTPLFMSALFIGLPYLVIYVGTLGAVARPFFARLGDLSYGTYLYAWPVQQTIAHFVPGISPWLMLAAAAPITLALAFLSWLLVESRFLRLKAAQGSRAW